MPPSEEDAASALATALLARIPARAVPVEGPGWRGAAWHLEELRYAQGIAVAAIGNGPAGPFHLGHVRAPEGRAGIGAAAARAHSGLTVRLEACSLLRFLRSPPTHAAPGFAAAELAAFARSVPARAILFLHRLGIVDGSGVGWIAGAGDETANLRLLAAYPWLLPLLLEEGTPEVRPALASGADPDAVATGLVTGSAPATPALAAATRRLRGMAWRQTMALAPRWAPDAARAMAGLPVRLWPPAAEGSPPASNPQQALLAFVHLAPALAGIAERTDREPGTILGTVSCFARYAETLSARAGHPLDKQDLVDEWAAFAVEGPLGSVTDMVYAAAEGLVRPALLRLGLPAPDEPDRARLHRLPPCGPAAGALRLLLGMRTLPALCELSLRWHARADALARTVAGIPGATPPPAGRVLPDLVLAPGVYATQLTSATELLDEGAPGTDATGAAGLDHCVASYAAGVASGASLILSVRRRRPGGYERLSTAELHPDRHDGRLDLVQHRGPGNAEPDPWLQAALERALEEAAPDLSALPARDAPPFDPAPALAAPGAWERMRAAWAFALPRPLRGADPAAILTAAGLLPAPIPSDGTAPLREAASRAMIDPSPSVPGPSPLMTQL